MSRNLGKTTCDRCDNAVKLTGPDTPITREQAGAYFDEFEGMIVADAECVICGTKYLAWLDGSKRRSLKYPEPTLAYGSLVPANLSYRSTFNDEPGQDDLPPPIYWEPNTHGSDVHVEAGDARLDVFWSSTSGAGYVAVFSLQGSEYRVTGKGICSDLGPESRRAAVAFAKQSVKAEQKRLARVLADLERVVPEDKPKQEPAPRQRKGHR